MIDSHCHINFPQYDEDRDATIQRAFDTGIDIIINPGTTIKTSKSAIALAAQYDNIYAAAGIHPTDVAEVNAQTYTDLESLLDHPKVVALGEIGMDFYHDATLKDKQIACMNRFVAMAKEKKKPLIIHNRESNEAMVDFLKDVDLFERPGVFHCFAGDEALARVVLDHGFYISFTGIVTFKNTTHH
jgi:TatD DNase family protein